MRVLLLSALFAGSFAPDSAPQAAPANPPAPRADTSTVQPDAPPAYRDRLADAFAAVPGGLTAEEVARRAVKTGPTVEAARADLQATAASVDATIARFVPVLRGEASYTRLSPADIDFGSGATVGALNEGPLTVGACPDGSGNNCVLDSGGSPVGAFAAEPFEVPLNNYSLKASLTVPFLDYALRLMPAIRGAEAETDAAILKRDAEKLRVQLDAQIAYFDWLRAKAQTIVAEQTVESTHQRLEDARVGETAGTMTSVDVLRLDGIAATAETSLVASQSFERLAAKNLAVIMGVENDNFEIGDDLSTPPNSVGSATRNDLLTEAYDKRLEMQAFERNAYALEEAKKAARADYYPRLDGFGDVTYANPNQRFFPLREEWNSSWSAGVMLSWQLDSFLQARARVKEFGANQRSVNAQAEAMRRAIEIEINAAWEERRRANETVVLTRRSALASEAAYEQQVALFQAGEATTTDLIDAEVQRLNATLRDINARIDVYVADAKLLLATGRMKPLAVEEDSGDDDYTKYGSEARGKRARSK